MIRTFIYCWAVYWALVVILPVHSIYPAVTEAFLLQLAFVCLVVAGYFTASPRMREIRMPDLSTGSLFESRGLLKLSIYMSVVGFACLLYDKIYIQHVDYSSGLAIAREQWRILGEEREGRASSMWSVLGYAFGSAYYVTVVIIVTQARRLTNRERLSAIAVAFLFALANSVITGGRSNFLLIAVVVIAALSARRRLRLKDVFSSRRQRRGILFICAATISYMVYIFYARAQASDEVVYLYVVNFLPIMGLEFDEWYRVAVSEGWIGAAGNTSILALGYLTHSFATTAAIVDAPLEHKVIIFSNVAGILYKFGLIARPDSEWFLSGRFPSVPGALWHQFGPIWFGIMSYALGVTGALTSLWARARPTRVLPLAAYILTATTLILTPFSFAPDFLSFPSVVVAFVILAMLGRFRQQLRSAIVVSSAKLIVASQGKALRS